MGRNMAGAAKHDSKKVFLGILTLCTTLAFCDGARTFTIDYDNDTFLKDGEAFQYISGSIHYSRVPYQYWKDRLTKMYAGGLNAIQTSVPWNVHEASPGKYDFSGQQDLPLFLKTAQDVGLSVLLGAGPYICGEWDYGGLPAWLVRQNSSIEMRSMDPGYITPVEKWMKVLMSKVKPLMYENGGPVLMVQVENEYGSYYACDRNYTQHLRDIIRQVLGDDAMLYTTDGSGLNFLICGTIDGVYTTVDFGPTDNVTSAFAPMRAYSPKGPLVNSQYYTGSLDHWGSKHSTSSTEAVVKSLKDMLDIGANVNMYMYEGGTNFGYTNGANEPFLPCPTSYDYDSPLTEAGDPTEKYYAIRNLTKKYKPLPSIPVPPATPKEAYGSVKMKIVITVADYLSTLTPNTSSVPLSMEELNQDSGFMMYRHKLDVTCGGKALNIPTVHDRAHVMVDGILQGILDSTGVTSMTLIGQKDEMLDILVENQGHISVGFYINRNRKGLDFVEYDGKFLTAWSMYPLNLTHFFDTEKDTSLRFHPNRNDVEYNGSPALFRGDFTLPQNSDPKDTYLRLDGWFKGQALLNGFNIGRYWPVRGPQITLYVPAPVLLPYPQTNTLIVMELDRAPCRSTASHCSVSFTDTPDINGPVDSFNTKPIESRH